MQSTFLAIVNAGIFQMAPVGASAPKNPVANIDVTNRNGEVMLMLPGDGNFTIDALSTRGDIESDFNLNQASDSKHEAHSTGTVGKGGPRVQVRDEHATIHINKR